MTILLEREYSGWLSAIEHTPSIGNWIAERKFMRDGIKLERIPTPSGTDAPLVEGCVAWLACQLIPEPHNQQKYDLFIGDVVGAWADSRVFSNGRWHFENAPDELRTIHHVAGGQYLVSGNAVQG